MFRRNVVNLFRLPLLTNVRITQEQTVSLNILKDYYCYGCRSLTTKIQHISNQNITNKLTEEEYLVKVKDDPDTFGNPSIYKEEYEEGDLNEEDYLQNSADPSRKLRTKQYADMIKAFIRKRQIKEAIDVLEVRMIKEDRVKPENYIYNLLLGACGNVGYTKKAFSLYNKMKQRGLKVTGGTYTALFNACANSPWPEDGLSRACHLREIMIEKGYEPNDTNYNAMIKAFGRCGDLSTAFSLVDEMQEKRYQLKMIH
ncbi:2-oxoglutarate and iron-dependent oxygenase domain-containing protein 2 [Holotrichia oblita]|uniref:2-oxoglutarate and iron-dependent oxygenase domain-containing protein 2 n=1 Tax=Holotrichia oblita TaxID=644536 RepID=A0ACB9TTU5_HOLOL|nr:2-oxoglutarate and iron-dependent oxygenase domain-containing protein 2 [Holotrichia oblita]